MSENPKIEFEYQISTKYGATAISFNAQTVDAKYGGIWSDSRTLQLLPCVLKGETLNNTIIQIDVTYYITEQQDNVISYTKVGSDKFELLVRDITE